MHLAGGKARYSSTQLLLPLLHDVPPHAPLSFFSAGTLLLPSGTGPEGCSVMVSRAVCSCPPLPLPNTGEEGSRPGVVLPPPGRACRAVMRQHKPCTRVIGHGAGQGADACAPVHSNQVAYYSRTALAKRQAGATTRRLTGGLPTLKRPVPPPADEEALEAERTPPLPEWPALMPNSAASWAAAWQVKGTGGAGGQGREVQHGSEAGGLHCKVLPHHKQSPLSTPALPWPSPEHPSPVLPSTPPPVTHH